MKSCILIMFLILCVFGCSSGGSVIFYDGENLPRDEIVVLRIHKHIKIYAIDGERFKVSRGKSSERYYKLVLLPGKYIFSVAYSNYEGAGKNSSITFSKGKTDLEYTFEAGKEYQIKYHLNYKENKEYLNDEIVTFKSPETVSFKVNQVDVSSLYEEEKDWHIENKNTNTPVSSANSEDE